jgi:hypothetical protein
VVTTQKSRVTIIEKFKRGGAMLPRAVCLYVEYYPIGFNKGQFELP